MRWQQGLAGAVLLQIGLFTSIPVGAQPPVGSATSVPSARVSDTPAPASKPAAVSPAAAKPTREEADVLQALQTNPLTAPYRIGVAFRQGKVLLTGRVGTSQVHDAAVRSVIGLGYGVRDELVIDTNEAIRIAVTRGRPMAQPGVAAMYPPSLYNRIDEPFLGFEPPLVSMPPWWGAVTRREPISPAALNATGNSPMPVPDPNAPGAGGPLPPDTVEATIDSNGVAVLRGVVKTMDERIGVGQKLAKSPGITQVINLIEVVPQGLAPGYADNPPPPPMPPGIPGAPAPSRVPEAPKDVEREKAPVVVDGDPLAKRVSVALAKRPALEGLPIRVANREGVVTLSGKVPSAFEAMLAYRAAEQVAGVKEVYDRMEFTLPDADAPNPLRTKGRPEDIEPYLLAQVRRQVGDLAHVDQIRLRGDSLEVKGTLARAEDNGRLEAALRSIPLLRGFRLEPTFVAE